MGAYLLNLLDLAFTLHALSNGGVELNPLMTCVPFQIVYKTVLVLPAFWWLRRHSPAGYRFVTALFAAVDLYHIYFIFGGNL